MLTCEFLSDRIEAEFGLWRQLSGGNYHISMQQVLSSLSFQRVKFNKLQCESSSKHESEDCCKEDLSEEVWEHIESCFQKTSTLTDIEKSTYLFCYYKCVDKVCIKELLKGFTEIYNLTGFNFEGKQTKILQRFANCFSNGFRKQQTEKIKLDKSQKNLEKRNRMESEVPHCRLTLLDFNEVTKLKPVFLFCSVFCYIPLVYLIGRRRSFTILGLYNPNYLPLYLTNGHFSAVIL